MNLCGNFIIRERTVIVFPISIPEAVLVLIFTRVTVHLLFKFRFLFFHVLHLQDQSFVSRFQLAIQLLDFLFFVEKVFILLGCVFKLGS